MPGRVSTEVDAHLSYNTQALIDKARLPACPTYSTLFEMMFLAAPQSWLCLLAHATSSQHL